MVEACLEACKMAGELLVEFEKVEERRGVSAAKERLLPVAWKIGGVRY